MHAFFCGEKVEFADNRAFVLGRRDALQGDHIARAAMLVTALECPLGFNEPRYKLDKYWAGVREALEFGAARA